MAHDGVEPAAPRTGPLSRVPPTYIELWAGRVVITGCVIHFVRVIWNSGPDVMAHVLHTLGMA